MNWQPELCMAWESLNKTHFPQFLDIRAALENKLLTTKQEAFLLKILTRHQKLCLTLKVETTIVANNLIKSCNILINIQRDPTDL